MNYPTTEGAAQRTLGSSEGDIIVAKITASGTLAYSTYFDRRVTRVVDGNYDATFTLDLMLKDVTLATEMAGALLPKLPILRETLAAYREGARRGSGAEDFSAVTHVVEDRVGHRLFAR